MAGLPWKCVQGCWALPLAFLVTAALCLFSWRGQMIVLPEVNHLWQICSAHTCADTLQAGWTSTGERFCLFKNVHILQCTFPSFHTLASGHWCFVITFFPSSSSPFYSPLFFCCQIKAQNLPSPARTHQDSNWASPGWWEVDFLRKFGLVLVLLALP